MTSRRAAVVLTGSLLVTSGCAALTNEGRAAPSSGTPQVVAAFYPLQFVAERVSGAEVRSLTSPGGEPHDLELGVRESAMVADADLLLVLSGFQPAVEASADEVATGQVLDAADVVELRGVDEDAGAHEPHEAGHEHDHGDDDPHFWLDPLLVADLGDAVAAALGELDPDAADEYDANAAGLRADLERLDDEYADALAGCAVDTVVTNHDAFGYLEKYGLHLEPIAGVSPDAEPTPAALARLQGLIRDEGVTTVFSESLVSPATAQALAGDLGLETRVLDTVEGLSAETADEDYLSLMRANLETLREGNQC
jgi:zinc transport system substrate-binding protein